MMKVFSNTITVGAMWMNPRAATAYKRRRSLSSKVWTLSTTVAVCSLGLVILAVLLTAIAGQRHLLESVSAIVPQPVHDFFEKPVNFVGPKIPDQVKGTVERAAPGAAPDYRLVGFTVGATETDVLRIQGRPGRTVGSTWFYGESEVQFVAGRVIAWKNSSKNPLRIR
jgi:hypothetical protein